jgi:hypothetical protein
MDLRVLVFALSVFLVFDFGEGISCHICNGYEEAKCKDPFGTMADSGELIYPANFKMNCSLPAAREKQGIPADAPPATMCRKIYQDVRGDIRVIRGCAWEEYKRVGAEKSKKVDCYKTVMEEYNTYVCTCIGDFCNGAKITQVPALLIAVLPLITFGIFHQ